MDTQTITIYQFGAGDRHRYGDIDNRVELEVYAGAKHVTYGLRSSYRQMRKAGIEAFSARHTIWYAVFQTHLAKTTRFTTKPVTAKEVVDV